MLIPQLVKVFRGQLQCLWGAHDVKGHATRQEYRSCSDLAVDEARGTPVSQGGRSPVTTLRVDVPDCRPDPVKRHLTEPHRLWVADITYVCTLSGFAYTVLTDDAYSQKIAGVATREKMRTDELTLKFLSVFSS